MMKTVGDGQNNAAHTPPSKPDIGALQSRSSGELEIW